MKLLPLVFLGLAVPAIASAQAMPAPQENPCTEAGGMVMGGVSVNEMKCKNMLMLQELGNQAATAADKYDTLLAKTLALQARLNQMETEKAGKPEEKRAASMGGIPPILNTPAPLPPKVPPQPAPPVIHPSPPPKK